MWAYARHVPGDRPALRLVIEPSGCPVGSPIRCAHATGARPPVRHARYRSTLHNASSAPTHAWSGGVP
ncbi:hypothetical protein GCM10010344_24300 [Streptomyces bluensis]|nr:hypothetical protein GCM10010344_24300 [Streptomyces bluensis]